MTILCAPRRSVQLGRSQERLDRHRDQRQGCVDETHVVQVADQILWHPGVHTLHHRRPGRILEDRFLRTVREKRTDESPRVGHHLGAISDFNDFVLVASSVVENARRKYTASAFT